MVFSNARARMGKLLAILTVVLAFILAATGCSKNTQSQSGNTGSSTNNKTDKLSGSIKIDGSSTVDPITEAVAEEFMKQHPDVGVSVGISGTGGGFKKFVIGEIDICDASRPIEDAEKAAAEKNGIKYVEVPIAYDGISLVTNKENTWAKSMTVAELKKIWEQGSKISNWNQINPAWPNQKLSLSGPGTDSGTFDYFTKQINGKEKSSRTDYAASEDDNALVKGVAGDKGGLGYFGYAYYKENKDKLGVLAIDAGTGAVEPNEKTIKDGTYKPLSRPLFLYINKKALNRSEVKSFVQYYLTDGAALVSEVGYVPLDKTEYDKDLGLIK